MDGEFSVLERVLSGVIGIIFTVGGWMGNRAFKQLDSHEHDIADLRGQSAQCDISLLKLENKIQEEYVKSTTLERLHNRIDDMAEDIKTLLRGSGH